MAKAIKRPPLSFRVMIRLSEPQHQQISREAIKRGITESGLIRMWAIEKLAEARA